MAGSLDFFERDVVRGDENDGRQADDSYVGDGIEKAPDLFEMSEDEDNKESNQIDSKEVEKEVVEEDSKNMQAEEKAVEDKNEESEEVKEVKKQIKELQAFLDEQEYKVPASARFKAKVDGEEQEVELQELLNNYSGKQAWDKKFTDLDKERKNYQSDLEIVNKYIGEFANKSKNDPVEALEFLAEQIGLDPFEYRKTLRTQLLNKYGSYAQMDEQEREMFNQKEELEYLRRRQQTQLEMHQRQQAQQELEVKYQQLEESHGINSDRRNDIVNQLQEAGYKDISPELVVQAHVAFQNQDRAFAALEKVNPEFIADNNKLKMLESLLSGNSSISDEELYEYANKLWGNDVTKAVQNLQKKLPKKEEQIKDQTYKSKTLSPNYVDFFK